jgi:hypothetical protein
MSFLPLNNYLATHNGDPTLFQPKLTMGELKPFMVEFVKTGRQALTTPEFKATLAKAFAEDGLFTLMRSPARKAISIWSS